MALLFLILTSALQGTQSQFKQWFVLLAEGL